MIGSALTDEAYSVFEAPDGMSSLDRLRSHPDPMVVLLDWMLPGMDGVQVLQAIAADRPPIRPHEYILMSAATDTPDFLQLKIPADLTVTFMAKPFDLDRMVQLMAQAAARIAAVRE